MNPKAAAAFDLSNEHKALVEEIFGEKKSMKHGEIVDALVGLEGCSRRTAERRVNNWTALRLIKKSDLNSYIRA